MRDLARFTLAAMLMAMLAACGDTPRVSINPATLPAATVGQPYRVAMTASYAGSSAQLPLTVSVTQGGNLPPGISVFQAPGDGTGAGGISGTPTTAGTYQFTIELAGNCTMGGCVRGSRDYTLVVAP